MRVVIAGSSGLIGTALVASLRGQGHEVVRLVRRPPAGPDEYQWDPTRGTLDDRALRDADAVVDFCGVGIGDKRWSGSYKQAIRDSRITPTEVLAEACASHSIPTFVNASGINFYGDTGDRVVDESAPAGSGFLAEVCRDWENATAAASSAGVRTIMLRSGVVLSQRGGMLDRLRPLYLLALGGRLGSGRQYFPWISLDDEIAAIVHGLENDAVSGPVNMVGPAPVTNAQFNSAMARAVHRPAPWVVPGFVLRAGIGEFAQEAILTGPRAIPSVLENTGFEFRHNTVGEALRAAVGR
ncbi:TIGR01777 family protein [Rhodococcus sp. BP-252]|uniref:TIGR01777 family oxidoreductase n=1 Tax=unclassified Rhodococcus (in: high G+C Gram-positive bacteria) TaxID=192944 RepID=UPI001430E6DE|nr:MULTISPECIES: TIGR01777 family oxidoreductase [unclassified Rhodococcus (in: high G+C Gram-positive bacteria)]MBY6411413.1 TIGR01777 family protein [Rhodococcus sp. BP-320]MBY6416072.1 TIGR01777 family protein [Rhodococcus sp. BP-321]MBY6420419.1 TIGR01777 family protein [Rhodococcus sp. BP-324]MBY6426279.1 TIGR01777 family protein [Rhodococcus sp. BP-323]MBY6431180.1 TIGR01777 family protein [Rhodococcus sp. BP-322]